MASRRSTDDTDLTETIDPTPANPSAPQAEKGAETAEPNRTEIVSAGTEPVGSTSGGGDDNPDDPTDDDPDDGPGGDGSEDNIDDDDDDLDSGQALSDNDEEAGPTPATERSPNDAFRILVAFLLERRPNQVRKVLLHLAEKTDLTVWIETEDPTDNLSDLKAHVRRQLDLLAEKDFQAACECSDSIKRELGDVVDGHRPTDDDGEML